MLRRVLPVLLVALILGGCGGDGDGEVFEDPNGAIEVVQGDRFVLQFATNPGIGFTWDLEAVPAGGGPVRLLETETSEDDPGSAGGSVTKRFVFEAPDAGTAELRFERDFRGDIDERRTVTVTVAG